jgi:hypothetical protein
MISSIISVTFHPRPLGVSAKAIGTMFQPKPMEFMSLTLIHFIPDISDQSPEHQLGSYLFLAIVVWPEGPTFTEDPQNLGPEKFYSSGGPPVMSRTKSSAVSAGSSLGNNQTWHLKTQHL